ncbi:MAG: helix-hairpin-helix domain-containing protein [Planctomycetes bacterium]|nr:helix-hairpin-helix domain-containing protein [Planctomycetota bacterium]
MAQRVHEKLGIRSLGELQAAAIDGRLATVPGMGRKRLRSVIDTLNGRMRQTVSIPSPPPRRTADVPSVAELLDVDREYREQAAAGKRRKIAPRRFNPTGETWLPILRTERHGRHYTALYSNTARAHELGTTHDWVVIYLDDDSNRYQCTVITSSFGALRGLRIIRGRERECREYY